MATGNITKTEWVLLGLTGVFLCVLLGLFFHDRAELKTAGVETAVEVPQEEIRPDLTPLDLNTAGVETLAELPGIGEELARRIVEYRTENGPFKTLEEIMLVPGIGEGKFAALEGWIAVNGETVE